MLLQKHRVSPYYRQNNNTWQTIRNNNTTQHISPEKIYEDTNTYTRVYRTNTFCNMIKNLNIAQIRQVRFLFCESSVFRKEKNLSSQYK